MLDHRAALVAETTAFADLVVGADQDAPVPTCPDWTVRQLLRHLGRGHRWAAQIVAEPMDRPPDLRAVPNGKPPDDVAGTHAWLVASAQAVLDAVDATGDETPVWTFIAPRPAAWWIRRRLHEATLHRADAAITVGSDPRIPAELAADGISEWLDLMVTRTEPMIPAGRSIALRAGDAGEWNVRGTVDGPGWTADGGEADVVLTGRASDLFLALSRRRRGRELDVAGDYGVWTAWLERTSF